ncbi:MAG: hypothetical protein U0992_15825, partial [Planctomycetaceae bacterium]
HRVIARTAADSKGTAASARNTFGRALVSGARSDRFTPSAVRRDTLLLDPVSIPNGDRFPGGVLAGV